MRTGGAERGIEAARAGFFKAAAAKVNRGGTALRASPFPAGAGHAIPAAMSDQRALKALARIEAALARIEAAAAEPAAQPRHAEELQQLRDVHQALRGKVESAIGQIDRLLAAEAA